MPLGVEGKESIRRMNFIDTLIVNVEFTIQNTLNNRYTKICIHIDTVGQYIYVIHHLQTHVT